MNLSSLREKIREDGVFQSLRYFFCRACAKTSMHLIGKWTAGRAVCERRIVFKNRQMQDFTDNARAMFEYLVENGYNETNEIVYMVSEKKKFRDRHYKNVRFITAESPHGWTDPRAYYYGATAKYFFYTNNSADLNRFHGRGQITVNLWHGCGYKGSAMDKKGIPHSETMSAFDYAIVPGAVFVETKAGYWGCGKEKLLPLGYPRYDWMLDKGNDREAILRKLFGWEDTGTKAVIWMPTFRQSRLKGYEEGNISLPYELPAVGGEAEMEALDAHCRREGILLIVKKHPLQTGWSQKRVAYTNIRYVTEELLEKTDILLYRLVGVCDGLLSDYSSIAVDFLLLDRPVGFVLTDLEMYRETRGFVFEDPLEYMPGEKIYSFSQLKDFLSHVAGGEDLFAEERHARLPQMHNPTANYRERLTKYLGIPG